MNNGSTPNLAAEQSVDSHDRRKADHIRINLEEDVTFKKVTNGLESYFFMHQALPELDLAKIDTSIKVLGKTLKTPLLISSMTGGTALSLIHLSEPTRPY